ncbi:MAG: hypothetical protein KF778_20825 [Rhodocyclaceae bacterium]|nr:hypothetical protein [Rhodocyclaceae bacterium]
MARPEERKLSVFAESCFRADRRNAWHQKFCSEPGAQGSKAEASARRAKPERTRTTSVGRACRAAGTSTLAPAIEYWRRPKGGRLVVPATPVAVVALQDATSRKAEIKRFCQTSCNLRYKEILLDQPAVLIGFIAQFTGSALQRGHRAGTAGC